MRLALIWSLQLASSSLALVARADAVPATPPAEAEQPAQGGVDAQLAQLESGLQFKTGDVVVGDKLATLHLGSVFRYLGPEDTEKVLVAWGNPPGSNSLGMLMPRDMSPFADESWAVIVRYVEEGHVDDEDAKDIDFNELLTTMKKDAEDGNAERTQQGFGAVHLVGWAEPPHYDASARKLYWAKELDFGGPEHTINYDIRALGRKGVLELAAVASLSQLALIKAEMPKVLQAVEFNQGHRYADFDPDVDEMAAYGIGALVAGKLAAKAGLFKIIVAALLASKKLLVAGAVAIGVAIKRLLGRKAADTGSSDTPAA